MKISSQTKNPTPPTTIKLIITKFTTMSPLYKVSDELGSNLPIKSKPALQNAEIE